MSRTENRRHWSFAFRVPDLPLNHTLHRSTFFFHKCCHAIGREKRLNCTVIAYVLRVFARNVPLTGRKQSEVGSDDHVSSLVSHTCSSWH